MDKWKVLGLEMVLNSSLCALNPSYSLKFDSNWMKHGPF